MSGFSEFIEENPIAVVGAALVVGALIFVSRSGSEQTPQAINVDQHDGKDYISGEMFQNGLSDLEQRLIDEYYNNPPAGAPPNYLPPEGEGNPGPTVPSPPEGDGVGGDPNPTPEPGLRSTLDYLIGL